MKHHLFDAKIITYLIFGFIVFPVIFFYFTNSAASSRAAFGNSYFGSQIDARSSALWREIALYAQSQDRYITTIKRLAINRAARIRSLIQSSPLELERVLVTPEQYNKLPDEIKKLNLIERPVSQLFGEFSCVNPGSAACVPLFTPLAVEQIPVPMVNYESLTPTDVSQPNTKSTPIPFPTSGTVVVFPQPTSLPMKGYTPIFLSNAAKPLEHVSYYVSGYLLEPYILIQTVQTNVSISPNPQTSTYPIPKTSISPNPNITCIPRPPCALPGANPACTLPVLSRDNSYCPIPKPTEKTLSGTPRPISPALPMTTYTPAQTGAAGTEVELDQ